jgi:hypothetical protein
MKRKKKHGVTKSSGDEAQKKSSGDVESEIHSDLTATRSIYKRGKNIYW